jgi:hypothetical protein
VSLASGSDAARRHARRVEWLSIKPEPTPTERIALMAALELALGTEAKEIPASGWSSPQYRDGSSLRPGMRVWTAGVESEAPRQPALPSKTGRRT